jgi:hypothetical protein
MPRFHYVLAGALAVCLMATPGASAAPLDFMLNRIPDSANFVFMANVGAIQKSPLGVSRNWAQQSQQYYNGGLTSMPPIVDRVLIAQQIDPNTMHHVWKIKIALLNQDVTAEKLAARESGTLDKVGGLPVVLSRGEYFVQFEPRIVAEAHPADRQKLARWLSFAQRNTKPVISQYLVDVVAGAGFGAQAVMAVDLKDVFDRQGIALRLKGAPWIQGKDVNMDAMVDALTGLIGLQVNIWVEDKIRGEIRLDFSGSPDALSPIVKDLIIGAMEAMGAAIEGLESWQPRNEEHSILIRGNLTEKAAKLLFSPADNRLTGSAYAKLEQTGPASGDPKAMSSLQFYRSLTTLLDELRSDRNTKTISQRGYWYQQYANKLDSLPVLNVDPDLLQFESNLSAVLRQMASVGQIVKRQNNVIASNQLDYVPTVIPQTYGGGGGYGPYGGYGWSYTVPVQGYTSNYGQIRDLTYRNANTEKAYREQTWNNIDNAISDLRRKMTLKYKIEF